MSVLAALATRAPLRQRQAVALLLAAVALLYGPSLSYGFLHDDFYFARPLSAVELASTFWGNWEPHGLGNQHYRPLSALSFALDQALWGARPLGYHLTSLLLFGLLVVLAYALLARLVGDRPALVGALVFACHPLSAAAAAWANQRTDSLMACFYLGALLAFTHGQRLRSVLLGLLLVLAALDSKEMALTFPAALLALVLAGFVAGRWRWHAVGATALLALGHVLLWRSLFPGKAQSALARPWEQSLATFRQLVPPVFLPFPYGIWGRPSIAASDVVVPVGWTLMLVGLLVLWLHRRELTQAPAATGWRALALGLIWPLLTVPPLLGLAFPDIHRLGLLPAFGAALAAAGATAVMGQRSGRRMLAVGLPCFAALATAGLLSGQAWGPGGFQYVQTLRWDARRPGWRERLSPEMRALFEAQVRRDLPQWAKRRPDWQPGSGQQR